MKNTYRIVGQLDVRADSGLLATALGCENYSLIVDTIKDSSKKPITF